MTAEQKADKLRDAFAESKLKEEKANQESKFAVLNTEIWAHADSDKNEYKIAPNPAVGEIELEKKPMSKEEANKLLHKIATTPIKVEKSSAEIEHEKYEDRKRTSDELSE